MDHKNKQMKVFAKGPEYREGNTVLLEKAKLSITDGLNDCTR